MKLKEFGIYTSEDDVRIIIEKINDEIYFLQYPICIFETNILTNQYINNTLGSFITENSNLNWSFVFSRLEHEINMDDFAYLGDVNEEEIKKRLLHGIKQGIGFLF